MFHFADFLVFFSVFLLLFLSDQVSLESQIRIRSILDSDPQPWTANQDCGSLWGLPGLDPVPTCEKKNWILIRPFENQTGSDPSLQKKIPDPTPFKNRIRPTKKNTGSDSL